MTQSFRNIALIFFIGLLNTGICYAQGKSTITVMPKLSDADATHDYKISMLSLAIEKSEDKYGPAELVYTTKPFTQGRAIKLLEEPSFLDVVPSGTTKIREQAYRAIKIPLMKGLLGYRVLVIRKQDRAKFAAITSPEQLKELVACQETYWPDTDILEANGFKVRRVTHYKSLFNMVAMKRCDYFPRGIHEGYSEIAALTCQTGQTALEVFDDIILSYPFPLYFFTSKNNENLANRVTYGLEQALEDGSFDQMMREHPTMTHLYPVERWKSKRFFRLNNPLLPQNTPLGDRRLWIRLGQ